LEFAEERFDVAGKVLATVTVLALGILEFKEKEAAK
jgi:hypothetical protein